MIKIALSLMLLIWTLFGEDYTLDAKYDIHYGFFGSIGEADANLKVDNDTYKIKLEAKAQGLVKILSKSRVEIYESTGIVKDGMFIPNIFISTKIKGDNKNVRRYLIDHKKKEVILLRSSTNDGVASDSRTILPYYSKNDILTLFFNLKHLLDEDFKVKDGQKFVAIGASKRNGKVNIENIPKQNFREIAKLLKKPENLLTVVLNQKIFASQKGEMFVNLNDDGICLSAVLKDVVMFGDIRGELVSLTKK